MFSKGGRRGKEAKKGGREREGGREGERDGGVGDRVEEMGGNPGCKDLEERKVHVAQRRKGKGKDQTASQMFLLHNNSNPCSKMSKAYIFEKKCPKLAFSKSNI
jgi:hypothetical protein